MWLDISGKYEQESGMLEFKGEGQLELVLTVPDLVKVGNNDCKINSFSVSLESRYIQ